MYVIPKINPLNNLQQCDEKILEIQQYKDKNWAIGQKYPDGGPDEFTYFFSIRNIPIANYLRGNISIGDPTAYDVNIKALQEYINWQIDRECYLVNEEISLIFEYKLRNFAIGESYPDGGPDEFVVFFAERGLPIQPYLRGSVDIGSPTAYCENIKILRCYLANVKSYRQYL